jgi:uncharacterized protein YigE (DUF2233 family)
MGGMYKKDNLPKELFTENVMMISELDTSNDSGIFYLKPNGVFYISTAGKASICKTEDFKNKQNVKYTTQSGPMLVIYDKINPSFTTGSKNLNIRNGVGYFT